MNFINRHWLMHPVILGSVPHPSCIFPMIPAFIDYNSGSLRAYEKMGFHKVRSLVIDIGGGFVMDDYELEKRV